MEFNDIETLADAAQWFRENTPAPIEKWWGLRCPRCRQRIHNNLYGTWMNYSVHYMGHLTTDVRSQLENEES